RLKITRRASANAALPRMKLVPNREPDSREGLGAPLRTAITERLIRREQTLLFINRRGFAPSLLCAACGWKAQCTRCAARLVVHRVAAELRCHHCGYAESIYSLCPGCGNQDLMPVGSAPDRLQRAPSQLYPDPRIP